jgi:hypothetical protein
MIFFFINKKQCPVIVENVLSVPLLFGIRGWETTGITEVISIRKLVRSSSSNSDEFKKIEWVIQHKGE